LTGSDGLLTTASVRHLNFASLEAGNGFRGVIKEVEKGYAGVDGSKSLATYESLVNRLD
jgi:hypothetical protein